MDRIDLETTMHGDFVRQRVRWEKGPGLVDFNVGKPVEGYHVFGDLYIPFANARGWEDSGLAILDMGKPCQCLDCSLRAKEPRKSRRIPFSDIHGDLSQTSHFDIM